LPEGYDISITPNRKRMPRAKRFLLLLLILITSILVIVRLSEYKGYFAQHNANSYVLQLFAILIAYVIAILFVGRLKGSFWATIFRLAMMFGLASGLREILAIAGENNAVVRQ
jgi:cell division protein FtsW (lipid II flippase)